MTNHVDNIHESNVNMCIVVAYFHIVHSISLVYRGIYLYTIVPADAFVVEAAISCLLCLALIDWRVGASS